MQKHNSDIWRMVLANNASTSRVFGSAKHEDDTESNKLDSSHDVSMPMAVHERFRGAAALEVGPIWTSKYGTGLSGCTIFEKRLNILEAN